MKRSILSNIALVGAALAGLAQDSLFTPKAVQVRNTTPQRGARDRYGNQITASVTGPGYGHAKVKRMARKRRNVLRNRKAHR